MAMDVPSKYSSNHSRSTINHNTSSLNNILKEQRLQSQTTNGGASTEFESNINFSVIVDDKISNDFIQILKKGNYKNKNGKENECKKMLFTRIMKANKSDVKKPVELLIDTHLKIIVLKFLMSMIKVSCQIASIFFVWWWCKD